MTDETEQTPEAATTSPDDVKARFREALDKKNKAAGDHATASGPSASGQGEEHGPAGGKRTFRRKSGG